MSKQPVSSKPSLTIIKGDNECELRLIRALDKAAGFKHDPEDIKDFYEASDTYRAENEAARSTRSRFTLVK